ncbi:FAD-binding oxidoreductase [Acidisoma cellulosilytica]|uniref:FAD-binding oxidoreductase n=1 Tax=Acidisoma cellulosilyticum TaxID=2802395 RepID=A0A963Z283_9PROT|nr:FAD-binding oxidoreductase [Acidisoma cellulosilyticum]MCB8881171.1 FAD-binding oxidoreductase [Acidisoma cellulosilyticum]
MAEIFAETYRADGRPYWWDELVSAPPNWPQDETLFDVAIIGSGFTGLSAALEFAEAGLTVLVIEAERLGHGASTRNGGMITGSLHETPEDLAKSIGTELAESMSREARGLVPFMASQMDRFAIDCDFRIGDHFMGAYTAKHYEALSRSLPQYQRRGLPMRMVPKADQGRYIATDHYQGGRLHEQCASVHPAKYHRGLVQNASRLGVQFVEQCRVTDVTRAGEHFRLQTARGPITARRVLMATNGYTSPALGWYRRRVVPMQSSIIATEELGEARMASLFPTGATVNDTKRILSYFRPSPDGKRLIYGGRATFQPIDVNETARRLRRMMLGIFPQLDDVKISHCWGGFVAFTFDFLPHAGQQDGVDYAMGYCGSGVALASWLGHRTALRMLGRASPSAFEARPFKTRPFYTGNPWMLPAIGEYFRVRDRIDYALFRARQKKAA